MRSILRRLSRSHGTAVAYLALFAALGGGMALAHQTSQARIVESAPAGAATGWFVSAFNQGTTGFTAFAWVICANVSS